MDNQIKKKITYLKNANSIVPINKGFSADKKYIIDGKYLLRLFSSENNNNRREEFNTIDDLATYSNAVPKAIEFGTSDDLHTSYMILAYLPGKDAEVGLDELTEQEQYAAGLLAGKELKKLHKLKAPAHIQPWSDRKKKKSDKYLLELMGLQVDDRIKKMLETYIGKHDKLMIGQPNTFQHDDFHPANLLINNRTFSGVIDFQRMDWGDPMYDFSKLGFFSSRVSIEFTKGIVDGYHNNNVVDESFWELYTLYHAMQIVSSLLWGMKEGPAMYEQMLSFSLAVIHDHEEFTCIVPKWYQSK